LSQSIISYTIENVDISDDEDPILYIQRYKYPKRTYRVIRKEWDEEVEGEFIPDPDYSESYWSVDILLLAEYDSEDESTEIFASIDRDEEHPPLDDPEEVKSQNNDACFHVVYDPEDQRYKCEVTGIYGDDVEGANVNEQDEQAYDLIAEPTLQAAINLGVALLDNLIENSKR
jgi:DNA polymerase III epsilon subunit-like protein